MVRFTGSQVYHDPMRTIYRANPKIGYELSNVLPGANRGSMRNGLYSLPSYMEQVRVFRKAQPRERIRLLYSVSTVEKSPTQETCG